MRRLLARLAARGGRPAEALLHLERLEARGDSGVALALLGAACHAALRDLDGFRARMSGALALARANPAAALGFPQTVRAAAGFDGIAWLRRRVAADPTRPESRGLLAELLLEAGERQEAELHIAVARGQARDAMPDSIEAAWLEGRARLERRDARAALESFRRGLEARPGWADLWCWTGLARLAAGQPNRAVAAFDRALELNRGYGAAWRGLALARYAAGDARGAALALRQDSLRHRERAPWPKGLYRLLARDSAPEARTEISRAMAFHPGYADLEELSSGVA